MSDIVKTFSDFVNENSQQNPKLLSVLTKIASVIKNYEDNRVDGVSVTDSNLIECFSSESIVDAFDLSVNGNDLEKLYANYSAFIILKFIDDIDISKDELSLIANSGSISNRFLNIDGFDIYGIEIKCNVEYHDLDYPAWKYSSPEHETLFYSLEELEITEDSSILEFGVAIIDSVNVLFDFIGVDSNTLQTSLSAVYPDENEDDE
ncbi:MAG TPA: hypothetical protein HA367_05615 [Candidatus Methanofastidiosum sp.]|nr:hypothetical protein [Methanofastidiosum sp.]